MEDSGKNIEKPANSAGDKKKVIELTPEMEIRAEKNKPVYDLTEGLDGTISPLPHGNQDPETIQDNGRKGMMSSFETQDPIASLLSESSFEAEPSKEDEFKGLDNSVAEQESSEAVEAVGATLNFQTADTVKEDIINLEEIADKQETDVEEIEAIPGLYEGDTGEEAVINLEEIVGEPDDSMESINETANMQTSDTDEEAIIDLNIIVDESRAVVDEIEEAADLKAVEDEESVISLCDIVEKTEIDKNVAKAMDGSEVTDTNRNEIIDLINIVSHPRTLDNDKTNVKGQDIQHDEIIDLVNKVEQAHVLEKHAHASSHVDQKSGTYEEISEEAIENYIRKKYQGNIEGLIAKIVEKTVQREISAIRQNYLEDGDR